jgi:hypothetical protein
VDPDSPWEKDYVQECISQQGVPTFKDIDLVWGTHYTCHGIAKQEVPCLMSTSMSACMPKVCTAADIVLVGNMETADFCTGMAQYNLTSCEIRFTK